MILGSCKMSTTTSNTNAKIKQLGLTTARLKEEIRKTERILSDASLREAVEKSKASQFEAEKEFIQSVNVCAPITSAVSNFLLADFDENKISNLVTKKFYDFESLSALACALDSIFVSADEYGSNVKLQYYLRNLMQIGADSVEGVAMATDLKEVKKAFVLKAPRKSEKSVHGGVNESLLHEFVVGNTLNSLRRYIPNFAMVHGAIIGSPPIINNSAEVIDWGRREEEKLVRYIVYENIAPGEDFASFSETCTFESWLNIYLQVLYACHFAYEMVGFTHYDLHDQNVIVRRTELPTPMYIPFKTEHGVEYMSCGLIGTLIDYGFATVRTPKGTFGVWDFMEFGVYPNHGYELHDAYKLLLMSMRTMKEAGNVATFDKCREILKFFNASETAESILGTQRLSYYSLPYVSLLKNVSMLDLTAYIRGLFPGLSSKFFVTPTDKSNVVSCVDNKLCLTKPEAMLEIAGTAKPNNIFSFFDLYTSNSLALTNIKLEDVVADFLPLYPEEMKKFYHEINLIYEDNLTENIKVMSIADKEKQIIIDAAPELREQLYENLGQLNKYLYLADLLDIARSVAKIYQDEPTLKQIYNLINKANVWFKDFEDYMVPVIVSNIEFSSKIDLSGLDKTVKETLETIVNLHKRIIDLLYT